MKLQAQATSAQGVLHSVSHAMASMAAGVVAPLGPRPDNDRRRRWFLQDFAATSLADENWSYALLQNASHEWRGHCGPGTGSRWIDSCASAGNPRPRTTSKPPVARLACPSCILHCTVHCKTTQAAQGRNSQMEPASLIMQANVPTSTAYGRVRAGT